MRHVCTYYMYNETVGNFDAECRRNQIIRTLAMVLVERSGEARTEDKNYC